MKSVSILLFVVGASLLAFGIYLSIRTNLIGAFNSGLDSKTENAAMLDFSGIVCILAGWGLRK